MLDPKNVYSMGRKAMTVRHSKEQLKNAKWTLKNAPSALTDDDRAILKAAGIKIA